MTPPRPAKMCSATPQPQVFCRIQPQGPARPTSAHRRRYRTRTRDKEDGAAVCLAPTQPDGPTAPSPWWLIEARCSRWLALSGSYSETGLVAAYRLLTPDSLHSNRRQHVRSSPDPLPPGAQHLVHLQLNTLHNTQSAVSVTTCESTASQDASRRSPRLERHDGGEGPRHDQDVSPSIPVRRRSLIQTPGVATRVARESPRVLVKTKLERRHTIIETDTLHVPTPRVDKYLSLTSHVLDAVPRERAVTPCEADYQQLGGMKFGTLRITNGSPAITPALEPAESEVTCGVYSERPLGHTRASSFESSWPLCTPTGPLVQPQSEISDHNLESRGAQLLDGTVRTVTPATALNSHPIARYGDAAPGIGPLEAAEQPEQAQHATPHLARQDSVARTSNGANDMDYLSPEVFNVRLDPNAKSSSNPRLPLPSKDERGSVARSDSGFVSASTSSSSSSRAALSKADSGYSSSFSLRSFRSSTKSQGRESTHATSLIALLLPRLALCGLLRGDRNGRA